MLNPDDTLKTRLKKGETLAGTFIAELRTANYGSILDAAGYDFALFDMEHCAFSMQDLAAMFPSFHGSRSQPVVRVPAVRREFFQPLLDLDVRGIMVPMVESPEEIREAVALMKYPPHGRRGVHFATPHTRFRGADRDAYARMANDNVLLIVQIETDKGLANLDAILDEPGVDVAFVGNGDLSSFMRLPNTLVEGPVLDAAHRILQNAKARGIPGGGAFTDPKFAGQFYQDGLRFVTIDCDVVQFMQGMRANLERLHAVLPPDARIAPLSPAKNIVS